MGYLRGAGLEGLAADARPVRVDAPLYPHRNGGANQAAECGVQAESAAEDERECFGNPANIEAEDDDAGQDIADGHEGDHYLGGPGNSLGSAKDDEGQQAGDGNPGHGRRYAEGFFH
ncbi:hypothetical protein D3C78_1332370 [compost metagenome]